MTTALPPLRYADVYLQPEGDARGKTYKVMWESGRFDIDTMERSIMTKDTLLQRILGYNVCNKVISEAYIRSQISEARIILMAYGKRSPLDRPLGFLFAHPVNGGRGLHVSIICGASVGRNLLNLLFAVTEKHYNYDYIELDSLAHVLSYYPQFGFEHRKSCRVMPIAQMSKELIQKIKRGEIKPNEVVEQIRTMVQQIYTLQELSEYFGASEANENRLVVDKALNEYVEKLKELGENEYVQFLDVLVRSGYGVAASYVDQFGETIACTKNMGVFNYLGHGCDNNGFYMRKCKAGLTAATTRRTRTRTAVVPAASRPLTRKAKAAKKAAAAAANNGITHMSMKNFMKPQLKANAQ